MSISENTSLRFFTFNQDGSLFAVLTEKGVHVFQVSPFKRVYYQKGKGINFVELVYSTNFLGYVSNERKKMQVYDIRKKTNLCEVPETREIRALKFTRKFFILIFDDEVDVFDRNSLEKKYWNVKSMPNNIHGVCATSCEGDIFAVPSPKPGEVLICDIQTQKMIEVKAHANPITVLGLNKEGSLLGTCSDGKNFKLFSCLDGKEVNKLRRGRNANEMYGVAFSDDSSSFCGYGASGTVHRWVIDGSADTSFLGYNKAQDKMYLKPGDRGKCCFSIQNPKVVHIVTESGTFGTIDFTLAEPEKRMMKIDLMKDIMEIEHGSDGLSQAKQLREKFPELVPVILDLKENTKLPRLEKRKFLIKKSLTMEMFERSIARKLNMEQKVKFYVGDKEELVKDGEETVDNVDKKYASNDFFLRMKYSDV